MTIYELIKKRNFYNEKIKDIDNFFNLGYKYTINTVDSLKDKKFKYVEKSRDLECIINRAYTTLEVTIDGHKMNLGGLYFLLESLKSRCDFLTTVLNNASYDGLPYVERYFDERDELFNKYLKYKSIFTKVVAGVTVDDLAPEIIDKNNDNGEH